jgi:hypothetical protein
MSAIPPELNWVEKRAACSVQQVFSELVRGIDNDVAVLNQVRQIPDQTRFVAEMLSDNSTVVVGQVNVSPRIRVKIGIVGDRVETSGEVGAGTLSARVALSNVGRCVLVLGDGTELEQWQFRKMALERLFFSDKGQQ